MPLQNYRILYATAPTGVDYVQLTNVQNIQFTVGRQAQLDQINASVGSFTMRYPTGYASPITQLVSGTRIVIQNCTGTPYTIFCGRISDVSVEYGIPYSGSVGVADYLTVTFEGAFAAAARMQGNNYAMAAGTTAGQLGTAGAQIGVNCSFEGQSVPLAATTISSTWGDWINRVCQTTNSRIWDTWDAGDQGSISVISPFFRPVSTINFSDTANNSTNQVYEKINFDSLADNFYTQVTVTPESFSAATVTKAGASLPYRTLQSNTLNASTSQATDYANYLLSNYGQARFAISSFTCKAEAQNSFQLDKIGSTSSLLYAVGTQVAVTFRGTTYQCIIEGVTMSATPAGASFTYYVSGADLNAYLILDNAVFGKLDFNKLGY